MTTPLNRAGSAGRATYMRVRYTDREPGWTVHRPSRPTAVPGTGSYDWATPSSRNSSITYPYRAASAGLPNGQPFPPVTGPLTVAVVVRGPVVTPASAFTGIHVVRAYCALPGSWRPAADPALR